ncbi:MAG: hypothetical protein WDA27_11480 [Actinomycetota bacterium]
MKRSAAASVLLAITVAASIAVVPGTAAADFDDGCVAVGTHGPIASIRPHDCYYTASGPGFYVAATTNPFVISVSRDGGQTWADIVRRPVQGEPTNGSLPTRPGDRVGVSVSCWSYTGSWPCTSEQFGGRYGVVWAQSDI